MRSCFNCKQAKPESDFYRAVGYCKDCTKLKAKESKKKNPERVAEQKKRYNKEHSQARNAYSKRYYQTVRKPKKHKHHYICKDCGVERKR